MGRQINYYIEEDAYKQIVEKALSTGFVVLYQELIGGGPYHWEYRYRWYEAMPNFPFNERHYFYLPSPGGFLHTVKDVPGDALDDYFYQRYEEEYEKKPFAWDGIKEKLTREQFLAFTRTEPGEEHLTWEQIKERKINLGSVFAPMIEAACSWVSEEQRAMASNRLYIRSDHYNFQGILLKQNELFIKQYESLVRAVKKIAPVRKIPCPPPYQDRVRKEYMTDYMFRLCQDGYDIR
jgi:hypothetical protein